MSYFEQLNMQTHGVKLEQDESYFNIKVRLLCIELLKRRPKQILGYKIENSQIIVATDCIFDKNYNEENYQNYFAFYNYNSCPPVIENMLQIKDIGNDNIIVKKTVFSKLYYIKF